MRTSALVLLMMTIASGCVPVEQDGASRVLDRLQGPMTAHAAALAGDDVALMRSTGRRVIAIYDAGTGPK